MKPHQRANEARRKMIRMARSIRSHDQLQKVLGLVPEAHRRQVFEAVKPYLRRQEEWGDAPQQQT